MNKIDTDLNQLDGSNLRIAIVASKYNDEIVNKLIDAAVSTLTANQLRQENIHIVRVPGAYEIPLMAQQLAKSYDAIIALGCVIRGETHHFEQVVHACSTGVARVMLEMHTPIAYGVLTVDNIEQALARAGGRVNRGEEVALAALEMAKLLAAKTNQ